MKFMISLSMLLLSLAAIPLIYSQSGKSAHSSAGYRERDMLSAIKQLEDELRIAVLKGDAGWWNAYLSDEYSETQADGKVRNRAQTLEAQRSKYLIYDTFNFSDRAVRTFNGDTVLVTGMATVEGTNQGKSMNGEFQFTRVWVKQGLEWKLASYQMTRIANANAAPLPTNSPNR